VTDSTLAAEIVPANKASWDDLQAVLGGTRCHGGSCYCQRFKLHGTLWPGDDLAHALEGYSMIPERGKDVPWGELHVGHVSIFTAAGFAEVSRPSLRRAVMRIDF
jgi:hypothetical protein